MALILTLQALVLGDGGLAALGANVLNMALLPAGLVALANRRSIAATAVLAGLAVPLAAALIVLETALFRPATEFAGWSNFAALMLGTHLWIGVLEAGATATLVAAFAPLPKPAAIQSRPGLRLAACCLTAALVLAAMWPLSSTLPDGYEAAAHASGLERLLGN